MIENMKTFPIWLDLMLVFIAFACAGLFTAALQVRNEIRFHATFDDDELFTRLCRWITGYRQ